MREKSFPFPILFRSQYGSYDAVTEYDGSQEWPDFAETKIRQAVEAALLEQRSEAEIEETMAARVNVLQTVSQVMAKELAGRLP